MVHHLAVDGVAEIVAATPDGMTLLYTSADAGALGLVDIANPGSPVLLPRVDVRLGGVGEPTSVAISPDGRYAVLALRMDDDVANPRRGFLRIYDIRNPRAVKHVKDVSVGIGPDSLALAGSGKTLRAVVAIEDEETDTKGDATLDGKRPGRIDVVGLQDLYGGASTGLQSIELVEALKALPDSVYPADPQPEFVALSPDGRTAAVTLQENNAVALIDLGPAAPGPPAARAVHRYRHPQRQRRPAARQGNRLQGQLHRPPRSRRRDLGFCRRVRPRERRRWQERQGRRFAGWSRLHADEHPRRRGLRNR